jgi:hypothetical protein
MKIALRSAALLTLWLAASLCLGALPKAAHASAFVNDIGNNRPVCAPAFNRAHPDLARFVAQAAEATLLIRCGNFVGSAVYVDTSSHRIVVTVEHIASNYSATNGKLVLDHVDDPKSCQVKNSRAGQWIAVDPAIAPKLGHPIDKLNLQAPSDWMVLALRQVPAGVTPLKIASAQPIREDSALLTFGALGWDGRREIDCSTVNLCANHDIWRGQGFANYNYTDCSSTSGGSGGAVVVHSASEGEASLAGILVGSVIDRPPGSPYDKDHMATNVISVGGPLLKAIDDLDAIAAKAGTGN